MRVSVMELGRFTLLGRFSGEWPEIWLIILHGVGNASEGSGTESRRDAGYGTAAGNLGGRRRSASNVSANYFAAILRLLGDDRSLILS